MNVPLDPSGADCVKQVPRPQKPIHDHCPECLGSRRVATVERQMEEDFWFGFSNHAGHGLRIGKIRPQKVQLALGPCKAPQACSGSDHQRDGVAQAIEGAGQIGPDEAGTAGDQDPPRKRLNQDGVPLPPGR